MGEDEVALDRDRLPLVGVWALIDQSIRAAIAGRLGDREAAAEVVSVDFADAREVRFCMRILGAPEDSGEIGILARALPVAEIDEESDLAIEPVENLVYLARPAEEIEPVLRDDPHAIGLTAAGELAEPGDGA